MLHVLNSLLIFSDYKQSDTLSYISLQSWFNLLDFLEENSRIISFYIYHLPTHTLGYLLLINTKNLLEILIIFLFI